MLHRLNSVAYNLKNNTNILIGAGENSSQQFILILNEFAYFLLRDTEPKKFHDSSFLNIFKNITINDLFIQTDIKKGKNRWGSSFEALKKSLLMSFII